MADIEIGGIEIGGEPEPQSGAQTKPKQRKVTETERQRLADQLARGRATAAANRASGKKPQRKTAETVRAQPGPTPAERSAEIREDWSRVPADQITRRKREERTVGALNVPQHLKKPGWDYFWMAVRVLNEPVDGARQRDFREGGWAPVLNSQMPELADDMAPPNGCIETEGCRLMTRPMRLTREAQQEDLDYALRQQAEKMRVTAEGREDGMHQKGATRPVQGVVQIEGVAG